MRSFLTALARDTRANTLALVAIAIIPLAGMVGGGIDISRMYIVKTRLQHGCDAGALAGRKAMGGGSWNQTVNDVPDYPRDTANKFFNSNFDGNAYGGTSPVHSFTENAGKVTGTASATVPMTLMRIFGHTTQTISVTCEADMRLPNTDVMFVLDTTGSMAEKPDGSGCDSDCLTAGNSKMQGLRYAVKCFYEIVARLDTAADCGGNPSGGTGNGAQIRFGFVPYSTNVNVGRLLKPDWFQDNPYYQTRKFVSKRYTYTANGTPSATSATTTNWNGTTSSWTDRGYSYSANSASNCADPLADSNPTNNGTPTTTTLTSSEVNGVRTVTYRVDQPVRKTQYRYNSYSTNNKSCRYDTRTANGTSSTEYTRSDTGTPIAMWNYDRLPQSIAGLKNGTGWNQSFNLQIGDGDTSKTIRWDGCIEERDTVATTNFSPIPSDALDLDIDRVPDSDASKWRPALPDLIYIRNSTSASNTGSWTMTGSNSETNYKSPPSYSCASAASNLEVWRNASAFETYVDGLTPSGATYHDIGLLWGARLMSPTGLFKERNALTPSGGEIERHLIFMTDGITNANATDYAAYGLPWFDRRQTDKGNVPAKTALDDQVNLRFSALCTATKNLGTKPSDRIKVWVIAFGTNVDEATKTRLRNCATGSSYFFDAPTKPDLLTAFRNIANQISALRLTN